MIIHVHVLSNWGVQEFNCILNPRTCCFDCKWKTNPLDNSLLCTNIYRNIMEYFSLLQKSFKWISIIFSQQGQWLRLSIADYKFPMRFPFCSLSPFLRMGLHINLIIWSERRYFERLYIHRTFSVDVHVD